MGGKFVVNDAKIAGLEQMLALTREQVEKVTVTLGELRLKRSSPTLGRNASLGPLCLSASRSSSISSMTRFSGLPPAIALDTADQYLAVIVDLHERAMAVGAVHSDTLLLHYAFHRGVPKRLASR